MEIAHSPRSMFNSPVIRCRYTMRLSEAVELDLRAP